MSKRISRSIPINVENWSEASQYSANRSASVCAPPSEYEDIHYECYHCRCPAIFPAAAQYEAFEVRKAYIWQRRVLCEDCFLTRITLEREVNELNRRWKTERSSLAKELASLKRWLEMLEKLPSYGAGKNTAHLAMLKRLITNGA